MRRRIARPMQTALRWGPHALPGAMTVTVAAAAKLTIAPASPSGLVLGLKMARGMVRIQRAQ